MRPCGNRRVVQSNISLRCVSAGPDLDAWTHWGKMRTFCSHVRLPKITVMREAMHKVSRRAHLQGLLGMAALAGLPGIARAEDPPVAHTGIGHPIKPLPL